MKTSICKKRKETNRQTLTRLSQPPLTKRFTGADRVPVAESKAALGPIAGAQLTALHPIWKNLNFQINIMYIVSEIKHTV